MPEDPEIDSSLAAHHRTVRSFVIRTGRATAAQTRALSELWPTYGIDFAATPVDLQQRFGRQAPRMIEIGFGAGEALIAFAQAHPHIDCLGIEVHPPGVGRCMLAAQGAGLTNVRVIAHDAVEVLEKQLVPESIDCIHIFFPDPWPKKRHHKRRLIQPSFVELLARVLSPGAVLRLATDWEPYALHMQQVIDAAPAFESAAAASHFAPRPSLRPLTRFERRGRRLGHGVWDLEYRKSTTR